MWAERRGLEFVNPGCLTNLSGCGIQWAQSKCYKRFVFNENH